MPDISVKYFSSTMSGAPVVRAETLGSFTAMMVACMVNGFGAVTLSGLTVSSGVATAVVNTGHGFSDYVTGLGPVLRVTGASDSGLNGDIRATIVNGTTFTYLCPEVPDGSSWGTVSVKRAPAGWSEEFAGQGTNQAALRSAVTPDWYFRVDHAGYSNSAIIAYKTMTAIATGTRNSGLAVIPLGWETTTSLIAWDVIADHKTFHIRVKNSGAAYKFFCSYGAAVRLSDNDVDCVMTNGYDWLACRWTDVDNIAMSNNVYGRVGWPSGFQDQVARYGTAVFMHLNKASESASNGTFTLPASGSLEMPYPNPLTGQLDVSRILLLEQGAPRAIAPGLYVPHHLWSSMSESAAYALGGGRLGKLLQVESQYATNRYGGILIDLVGPW